MAVVDLNVVAFVAGRIMFPREYGLGGIEFDTVISEAHTAEVGLTRLPVERGMVVTDNIVIKPFRITVDGLVTEANENEFFDYGIQGSAAKLVNAIVPGTIKSKIIDTYDALIALLHSGKRLSVQTGLRQYDNMVLVSVTTRQDKSTSMALRFLAVLEEVRIVSTAVLPNAGIGETEARPESRSEVARENAPTADRTQAQVKQGKVGQNVSDNSTGQNIQETLGGVRDQLS